MKCAVYSRLTNDVIFEADLHESFEDEPVGVQLGEAVRLAVKYQGDDLAEADLSLANLELFKQDMIAELLKSPDEIEGLRQALIDGNIDGTTYSGDCACLAGTIAKECGIYDYRGSDIQMNGVTFRADSESPREQFFLGIMLGDTPQTNALAAGALKWIDEAIAIRDNIRGSFRAATRVEASGLHREAASSYLH